MNAWFSYVGCGFIALSVLACGSKGSDEDNDDGTGGTSGTSGTGAGGTSMTGGSSGSATGGTGGGSMAMLRNGFDTGVESWIVEYTSSGTGVAVIDKSTVTLAHNADDGEPDPGMLEGGIPYTAASQYVGFGINYATPVDMSTSMLTANVRIAEGLGDPTDLMTNPGGAKLYAKSGAAYCYAAGQYNNLTMIGTWLNIRFDMTGAPDYEDPNCTEPFNPADIREIGVQFDTGGTSTTAQAAVVNIDTVMY
jgi:hypothetical protein